MPKKSKKKDNKIKQLSGEVCTEFQYTGSANYKLLFNNNPIDAEFHNSGTAHLQKAFALFASGKLDTLAYYVPKYLDITNEAGTKSYLSSKINLSGSKTETQSSGTVVAVHNATIDVANVPSPAPTHSKCKLRLLNRDMSMVLAEITVDADSTINLISGNVSGVLTWIMKLNVVASTGV